MSTEKHKQKLLDRLLVKPTGFWSRFLYHRAIKRLALYDSPDVVEPLAKLVTGSTPELASRAAAALQWMNSEAVKVRLAELYLAHRSPKLLRILRDGRMIPDEALELKTLMLLKIGEYRKLQNHGNAILDPLLKALQDRDEDIVKNAERLFSLLTVEQKKEIAQRYLDTRDPQLEELIRRFSLFPEEPKELKVLLSLKFGRGEVMRQEGPDVLPLVIAALNDPDHTLAEQALNLLTTLENPETIEALCKEYIEKRDPRLGEIIVKTRYLPKTDSNIRTLIRLKLGMIAFVTRESGSVIEVLLEARRDLDSLIRENAEIALRSLKHPEAINQLCERFVKDRDPVVAQIIKECSYKPTEPLAVKVLTLLKLGQYTEALQEGKDILDLLIQALDDPDEDIRTNADYAISALSRRDMIEEICTRVLLGGNAKLEEAAVLNGLEPSDPARKALFYFVTEQFTEYEKLDQNLTILAKALRETTSDLRSRLLEKIRATANPKYLALLQE